MEIFILLFTFYIVGGDGNEKWNKNCMFHWSTLIFQSLVKSLSKTYIQLTLKWMIESARKITAPRNDVVAIEPL